MAIIVFPQTQRVYRAHRLEVAVDRHAKRAGSKPFFTLSSFHFSGAHEMMTHDAEIVRPERTRAPQESYECGQQPSDDESAMVNHYAGGSPPGSGSFVQSERGTDEPIK